jgi:CheY-like chemotaxis protein
VVGHNILLEDEEVIAMVERRQMNVLIVEDNHGDARLVKELVEESGMPTQITLVGDGEGAIRIMESAAKGESPAPDLVLLDINLPRKNGHEVLASIRAMERSSHIYIAMCSGSNSQDDMVKAQRNGANAYLIKPMDLEEMDEMAFRLREILTSLNDGTFPSMSF